MVAQVGLFGSIVAVCGCCHFCCFWPIACVGRGGCHVFSAHGKRRHLHSHGAAQAGVTTCSAFLDEFIEDGMRDMPLDWMCSGRPRLGFWYEPHCYRHATCRMGRRHLGRQAVGVGLAMGHSRRQAGLEDLRTQRVCVVLRAQRVCEVSHFGLRRQARAPQASWAGGWAGDGALTSTGRALGRGQRIGKVTHLDPRRQRCTGVV